MLEAPPVLAPSPVPSIEEVRPLVRDPPVSHPVEFTGTGAEYFRIWIVNLALTVVTLGIFSAWAKVRRTQFFYRHTRVAGAGFDYHANPIVLLKGRLVALGLFGLYSSMGYVGTSLTVVIVIVLATLLPWLLGRSLRFRLHNTSYRGLRFRFHGTTKQAYWVFLGLPVLTLLTLALLGPLWHHRLKNYQFSHAAYGSTRFTFNTPVGSFYAAHVLSTVIFGGIVMAAAILAVAVTAAIGFGSGEAPLGEGGEPNMAFVLPIIAVGYMIGIAAGQAVTGGRLQNAIWNYTTLGESTFISSVKSRRLFWILLTNLLGTVATLGMYRPFAQVRLARYYASSMTVVQVGALNVFAAEDGDDVAATGEETADLFDFDIGF